MGWFGVVLFRQRLGCLEFCVHFCEKREDWELPKGGAEIHSPRKSSQAFDSSYFATARWELFEECNVWLAWRKEGAFQWVSKWGALLPSGSAPERGFVCTMLQSDDEVGIESTWMTLRDFDLRSTRKDHKTVMSALTHRHGIFSLCGYRRCACLQAFSGVAEVGGKSFATVGTWAPKPAEEYKKEQSRHGVYLREETASGQAFSRCRGACLQAFSWAPGHRNLPRSTRRSRAGKGFASEKRQQVVASETVASGVLTKKTNYMTCRSRCGN
jgi:hypothetical protein